MKKISVLILSAVLSLFVFSCAEKGDAGPSGADAGTVLTALFQKSVSPAGAAEEAVADNYLNSHLTTANNGSSDVLLCGRQSILVISPPSQTVYNYNPIIKFDTTILPPDGIEVTEAYLELYADSYSAGAGVTLTAYPITTSWIEDESSYELRDIGQDWNQIGGDYDETLPGTAVYVSAGAVGGFVKIPLNIDVVTARVNNPMINYGYIIGAQAVLTNFFTFSSSDETDLAKRPKMVVKYRLK